MCRVSLCVCFMLLLVFPSVTVQEEQYEPTSTACNGRCICNTTSESLVMDCTKKDMLHVLANWPPHPAHLIASFSWNNISQLQQIPASNATTISLSFSHCGISSLKSALFIDATGIEFLDLSWNLLTGYVLTPDVFRGRYNNMENEPIKLQQLNLAHNMIESLGHALFEHTPNLIHLDLSYNPLRIIDPQTSHALSSLLHIQTLNLANTSISKLPESAISRLQNLRDLDLSRNIFTKTPLALGHLGKSLEKLKMNENPIIHLNDESFMGLHALRELNISGMTELRSITHNTFSKLNSLRTLHCTNNDKLYYIHQEAFGVGDNIPYLKEVYLSENNLESLYPHQLHWSNISFLDLTGNRWLCDCDLYETILQLNDSNSDIIKTTATCALPLWASDVPLHNLTILEQICEASLHEYVYRPYKGSVSRVFQKTMLVICCLLLTIVGCYVFWKVLAKYKNIRAINTMYPVMYVSAPTSDHI